MLDDARKARLIELFAEAAELPFGEQAAFVARSCGDDDELRVELLRLLKVSETSLGEFLAQPAVAPPPVDAVGTDAPQTTPPEIPGYVDLQPIGEGGMGTVYRAQQVSPVRRTVAIKAIRPGMDTRHVLARFAAEREALARMGHPYIAAVYDAGADAQGRPYLAMEFVDGLAINEFCRREDLDLVPLLELFVRVCEAVDHAHRRGVLHRDLKPNNVLVAKVGDEPLPKVIDFGIAKALEGSLGDESIHTLQGSLLGTPEYMSPEQLDGDSRLIDTRTDVYALGAMLYELLCGERVFDSQRLRTAGITGLARIVREEVPPRPSTRLRMRADTAVGKLATLHWSRQLHTDLDWVVMKALEKDPERRYATPRELAEDLRRFLDHQPIHAGPPSGYYRMRKFARRYRLQLTAAALVIVALAVGLAGTLWFLLESKDNEARALANAREAEGTRLAATAALVTEANANLGLLLAIEADQLTDDFSVTETIYGALPLQNLVGRFQHSDYGTINAEFVDDRRLLSIGVDPVFWLTDVETGALERRFVGHADALRDMSLSPARDRVVTGSNDHTARVWEIATGTCLLVIPHPDRVSAVAWSPDGGTIATVDEAGAARLFAADTGAPALALADEQVKSLAFDDTGSRLVTRNSNGDATVWDKSGAALLTIDCELSSDPTDSSFLGDAQFAANGTRLVLFDWWRDRRSETRLCGLDGGLLTRIVSSKPLRTTADRLLVDTPQGCTVVSLETGAELDRRVLPSQVGINVVSPDLRWAIGMSRQEDICIVDLEQQRIVGPLAGENDKNWRNRHVAFHPDGQRFVVTGRELLMGRFHAEYAPFDLPLEERVTQPVSLSALGEALVLIQHRTEAEPRWSLWSIDQQRKLRDLPIEGMALLQLVTDGTALQGWRAGSSTTGGTAGFEVTTFDLEGNVLHRVLVEDAEFSPGLRPEGDLFATSVTQGSQRLVSVHDAHTGELRHQFAHEPRGIYWGQGPVARHVAMAYGSRTFSEVFDLQTGERIAQLRDPIGPGHYGAAYDELHDRLLIVRGDLRAHIYDMRTPGGRRIGEYTRIVRSNTYPCGFLPDGSMAWVMCANELHLFDAATCAPFAAIRLRNRAVLAAARADSKEIVTITGDGRCERWPIDAGAVARRIARGSLQQVERDLYRVGTPAERVAAEERRLRDNPTSRNHALLGELALQRGDLDAAIEQFRECCGMGPLAPMDLRRYLRLLELLARRHQLPGRAAAARAADYALASTTLREAVRCGVTRAALEALPGFDSLTADARLEAAWPR
ncbi:MAG: WD40 repeat domain-containing serine/threonine-protein kinase [Planctomycetota bacterium]